MPKVLECPVFEGNNPLTGEIIWNHVVRGSPEMKDKLKAVYNWDGYSTVAAVAANLDKDGEISNWELHIFGKSKGSKLDSSTFYTDQDEGNYIRFKEMEMSNFHFKKTLASEWLSPSNYSWEYRLPHETDRKKFYSVKEGDLSQYNAKPLWVRSLCQVTPGPKLQIFLGCAPTENVGDLPGSAQDEFPLILLEKFSVPLLPFEDSSMGLGMGPIPFLIDQREGLDFDQIGVSFPDGESLKKGMSNFLQSSIKPNQRNEISTWTKEVAVGNWVARSPNYTWPDPKPLEGDKNSEVEEDDDAGQLDN